MRIVGAIAPRIGPWRAHSRRWWDERSRRERVLLAVLGALLAAAAIVVLLVRPLQSARAEALANLRTYETMQARLRAAGPPSSGTLPAPRSGTVAAIVAASAPTYGIVAESAPLVGGAMRVRIAAVPYDALIRWLADLGRTSDLRVETLGIARTGVAGTVAADLVLSR